MEEFKIAHEAYQSQIKTKRERQESEKYYALLVELASELGREISSWIMQPDAQRLSTAQSAYVAPEGSVSNARSRYSFRKVALLVPHAICYWFLHKQYR